MQEKLLGVINKFKTLIDAPYERRRESAKMQLISVKKEREELIETLSENNKLLHPVKQMELKKQLKEIQSKIDRLERESTAEPPYMSYVGFLCLLLISIVFFTIASIGESSDTKKNSIHQDNVGIVQEDEMDETAYEEVKRVEPKTVSMTESQKVGDKDNSKPKFDINDYEIEDVLKTKYAQYTVTVREYPENKANVIKTIEKGEELTITGRCVDSNWLRVQLDNGVGYVSEVLLVDELVNQDESVDVINERSAENKYTYKEIDKTMYAISDVNVRDLPGESGNKLGGLAASDEVKVTGQCNENSWYRILFNGNVAYVSNNYLSDEKPVQKAVAEANINSESNVTASSGISGGVTVPSQADTTGDLVWVPTNGGTKYHRNSSCSKMKDPIQVTRDHAISNGFGPCGRCKP